MIQRKSLIEIIKEDRILIVPKYQVLDLFILIKKAFKINLQKDLLKNLKNLKSQNKRKANRYLIIILFNNSLDLKVHLRKRRMG